MILTRVRCVAPPPGRSLLAAPHLPSRAGAPLGAPRRDVQGREKTSLGPPCLRCYDPEGGGRKRRRRTARSRALWCRGAGRPAGSLPERPGAARGRIPGTRSARVEAGALHPPKATWDSQEKCWARHMTIMAHDDICLRALAPSASLYSLTPTHIIYLRSFAFYSSQPWVFM